MLTIVSWNGGGRSDPWRVLLDSGADLALLQEAKPPPPHLAGRVEVDPAPWRAAVARLADRIRPWTIAPIADAGPDAEWAAIRGVLGRLPEEDRRLFEEVEGTGTLTEDTVAFSRCFGSRISGIKVEERGR